MLTRYVFFEGQVLGDEAQFRQTILRELMPLWQGMPNNCGVRVSFAVERDEGAPEIAMVLAVDYPDRAAVDASLASDHRIKSRDHSAVILGQWFSGRVHHHVTQRAD